MYTFHHGCSTADSKFRFDKFEIRLLELIKQIPTSLAHKLEFELEATVVPHVSSVPATLANSTFVDGFYITSVQPYVIIMREDNPLVISFLSNSNLLGQVNEQCNTFWCPSESSEVILEHMRSSENNGGSG